MAERTKEELSGNAGPKELGPGAFRFKCPECDFEGALPGYEKKEGAKVMCPKCANPIKTSYIEEEDEATGKALKE